MSEKLINIIREYTTIDTVTLETNIGKDLKLDSMGLVEMVLIIEDAFQAEIPETALDDIRYVKDLIQYLK